jgi:hypothetical protein
MGMSAAKLRLWGREGTQDQVCGCCMDGVAEYEQEYEQAEAYKPKLVPSPPASTTRFCPAPLARDSVFGINASG